MGVQIFLVQGGKFDWSPARFGAASVYYECNKYNFKTAQPVIGAAQGKLTYKGKVEGNVPGVFEFKSVKHTGKKNSIYPRFKSYENNVSLADLGSDKLKYTGGFGLEGTLITSNSVTGKPAMLEVLGESDKKFKAISLTFSFKDSLILSNSASIVIYQGADSITHPSLHMRYQRGKKETLLLTKDNSPLRNAPFTATYFGIDFHADIMRWNLKSDSMDISMHGSGRVSPMIVESSDFYDPNGFGLLTDPGFEFNPPVKFVNYAFKEKNQDFTRVE